MLYERFGHYNYSDEKLILLGAVRVERISDKIEDKIILFLILQLSFEKEREGGYLK